MGALLPALASLAANPAARQLAGAAATAGAGYIANRLRGRKQGEVGGGNRAGPIARTRVKGPQRRRIRTQSGGMNSINVASRERLMTVRGNPVGQDFTIQEIDIQPGNVVHNPWLAAIASRYETYEVMALRYEFVPKTSTLTSGNVIMVVDFDALNTPPTTAAQAEAFRCAKTGAPWSGFELVVPRAELHTRAHRYIRMEAAPAQSDLKTYDFGKFYLLVESDDALADQVFGQIYVHYDIVLESPYLGRIGSTTRLAGAYFYYDNPDITVSRAWPGEVFQARRAPGDPMAPPTYATGVYIATGMDLTFNINSVTATLQEAGEYVWLLSYKALPTVPWNPNDNEVLLVQVNTFGPATDVYSYNIPYGVVGPPGVVTSEGLPYGNYSGSDFYNDITGGEGSCAGQFTVPPGEIVGKTWNFATATVANAATNPFPVAVDARKIRIQVVSLRILPAPPGHNAFPGVLPPAAGHRNLRGHWAPDRPCKAMEIPWRPPPPSSPCMDGFEYVPVASPATPVPRHIAVTHR